MLRFIIVSNLNALPFLHIHKHLVDALDLLFVANDFVSLNDVRGNDFGTFVKTGI